MVPQVLVVGAIEGHLRKAFDKISKLHKKADFSFCIVVGDLFGDGTDDSKVEEINELLAGSLTVPLPTYFTVGNISLPEKVIEKLEANDEVCTNLFYLGRKGTLKTSDGIRIVTLGGQIVHSEGSITHSLGKYDPLYLEADVRGLVGAHSADILISNQWPAHITTGSQRMVSELLRTDQGITSISQLCSSLRPRYHFASSPTASWEREPFKHPVEYGSLDVEPITRFRSLASVTVSGKDWFAAFKLDPAGPPPDAPDATTSPFRRKTTPNKRFATADHPDSYARYSNGHHNDRASKRPRNVRDRNAREACFFCMSSPDFNAHMVASVGEEAALTIPKGPLPLPTTFPALSFSGHVLIIPFYHAGEELTAGPRIEAEFEREFADMTQYRKLLCKMLQSRSNGSLGAVCWDANRTGIRHMHWQFLPAPADLIREGVIEAAFKASREKNDYAPFQACDPSKPPPQKSDYFRVWIWTPPEQGDSPVGVADRISGDNDEEEGTEKSIFFPLPTNQRFNIWFGREVMASVLGLDNRVRWTDVEQSQEDEEQDRAGFEKDFEPFNPMK